MPVRFASAATATASPAVDAPTWSCATCAHVNARSEATCSMCESSRVAAEPQQTPRDASRDERDDASSRRSEERREETSDEETSSSDRDASRHPASGSRTMHQSLSKLVTRFAAPATSVFNKALVGAFAAGASVGAAGAVAARAASRGVSVLRGAGVGAVAGAAVSVEALTRAPVPPGTASREPWSAERADWR